MASTSNVIARGSTPMTGKQLKRLLDDKRLIVTASASRPTSAPRVVVLDEVDAWRGPEHQRLPLVTRG